MQAVRIPVLEAAGERCVPLVAMMFVSVDPHDLATFEQFETIFRQLLPVFLQCLTAKVHERIASADRVKEKVASEQSVRSFLAQHQICAFRERSA